MKLQNRRKEWKNMFSKNSTSTAWVCPRSTTGEESKTWHIIYSIKIQQTVPPVPALNIKFAFPPKSSLIDAQECEHITMGEALWSVQEGGALEMGARGGGQWAGISALQQGTGGEQGSGYWHRDCRDRHLQGTAQLTEHSSFWVLNSQSTWWRLLFKQSSC